MSHALPVFNAGEKKRVQMHLASTVAHMMGRKLEEDDWTAVYCAAKRIPRQAWSNLNVDVMYGALGVEQKMLCYRSKPSLLEACGTRLMHPAATRSLRVRDLNGDPDVEMANIFAQYAELLEARRETVAARGGVHPAQVDLRTGWLLWQQSLREFLYFEEPMLAPEPEDFEAHWSEKSDGKRKGSRNLWIYSKATGEKCYSLTTSAGVKLQPYFRVPGAMDPNIYHWTVIGDVIDNGDIRIWLTNRTAQSLQSLIGSLDREVVSSFILKSLDGRAAAMSTQISATDLEPAVTDIVLSPEAYSSATRVFTSTNDDHLMQLLIDDCL